MPDSALEELPPVLGGFDLTNHVAFAEAAEGFPYETFARLRSEAPVFFHPPGQTADGEGIWVLIRHADIARVAPDPPGF